MKRINEILSIKVNNYNLHPLEVIADFEFHFIIRKEIKNNDEFSKLLMNCIDISSLEYIPMYILVELRDKNIDNLYILEEILKKSKYYNIHWLYFLKAGYKKHNIDFDFSKKTEEMKK